MVEAICDGAPVAPIKHKIRALKNRRLELEALFEDVEASRPLLHPNMSHRYRAQVGQLIEKHRAET